MHKHIAIWIDHKEARIFHVHPDPVEGIAITSPVRNTHYKHLTGGEGGKEHADDIKRFFRDVIRSLEGVKEILVVGPSSTKLEFLRHVRQHDQSLERRIIGLETVERPTDAQLLAYAKKYFNLSEAARAVK